MVSLSELITISAGGLGDFSFTNVLKIPDVYGGGVSIKPNDHMTITSDVVRIQYSQLTEGLVGGINLLTLGNGDNINYEVKDATEFHVGTEFIVFLGNIPVALRAGYYYKPIRSLIVESTQNLQPIDAWETTRTVFADHARKSVGIHFHRWSGRRLGRWQGRRVR